jgi:hypothetical protein
MNIAIENLEGLQKGAVNYFLQAANPINGLIADSSREGAPCSIAATGFGLATYLVGVERGFLTRLAAIERTLKVLRFLRNSDQGEHADATGYRGFYYHFLDMDTGRRIWDCELSMIDTAILIAGILASGSYFSGTNTDEQEIRELAKFLYERVDWRWATAGGRVVRMGWRPAGGGFLSYGWEGYSEAMLLYILGLGSPTHPLGKESYDAWTRTFQWENLYDIDFLFAAPLFIHQFTHLWVDLRGIQDEFMRQKNCNYFENSSRAVRVQQQYAIRNPLRCKGYGKNSWGVTAGLGPGFSKRFGEQNIERQFYAYTARGIPFGPDDGTLAPWAVIASLPFAPEIVSAAFESFRSCHPEVLRPDGVLMSLNPSFRVEGEENFWVSSEVFGIEQGPVAMMIENFRSELFWQLMRKTRPLMTGLHAAGFTEGRMRSTVA